jgi:glycosyltransferase involved in cell wall biosynthesis
MDKKIKVVRIINRFNLGGPVYNATFLTKFLGDEFDTTLIGGVPAKGETDAMHILRDYGVEPIVLPSIQRELNPKMDYKAYKKIKRILQEIQPDIVHTHASKAGFLGRYAAIQLGIPVVVHTFHGHVFHSYFGSAKTTFFKKIERYLARKTSGIIAISDLQKKELVETYKISTNEKMKVIPLGFDLEKFTTNKEERRTAVRKEYNIKKDEVAIALVGRLAPIKDHAYFLTIIEQLLEQTKTKIKVFIVGNGSEWDRVASRVDEINNRFGKKVIMTSWILDISRFNQGLDIMCLTSKNEGTPVSVIEALASGIPVISTDVGGVRDILTDGKSGFVIKRENSETYLQKLRLLVEDESLREDFSKFGKENVIKKYTYQRLVDDMREYYKALLER